MSVSGTIYLFPTYSETLRNTLGYTTSQINLVGTLINAGEN